MRYFLFHLYYRYTSTDAAEPPVDVHGRQRRMWIGMHLCSKMMEIRVWVDYLVYVDG